MLFMELKKDAAFGWSGIADVGNYLHFSGVFGWAAFYGAARAGRVLLWLGNGGIGDVKRCCDRRAFIAVRYSGKMDSFFHGGFFQYISPTISLLLGIVLYQEAFTTEDFMVFIFYLDGLVALFEHQFISGVE